MDAVATWLAIQKDDLQRMGYVTLAVRVIPNAKEAMLSSVDENNVLKLRVTAAPEQGKANNAVRALIADAFSVSRSNVVITHGKTSRDKMIQISL